MVTWEILSMLERHLCYRTPQEMFACCDLRSKGNRCIYTMLRNVYVWSFYSGQIDCVIWLAGICLLRVDGGGAGNQLHEDDYHLQRSPRLQGWGFSAADAHGGGRVLSPSKSSSMENKSKSYQDTQKTTFAVACGQNHEKDPLKRYTGERRSTHLASFHISTQQEIIWESELPGYLQTCRGYTLT